MRTTLVVIGAGFALAACASAPPPRPASLLALRQVQSRTYAATDPERVLRAVLAAFQDDGFAVRSADAGLGLVTATHESLRPANGSLKAARWTAAALTYGLALLLPSPKDVVTQLEGTAQVEALGEGEVRLRVSFRLRVVDSAGRVRELRPVTDPRAYQVFHARVDQSVFLRGEGL